MELILILLVGGLIGKFMFNSIFHLIYLAIRVIPWFLLLSVVSLYIYYPFVLFKILAIILVAYITGYVVLKKRKVIEDE